MGGKKKQTIGYRYFAGMHLLLFRGVADYISRISYANKTAWEGVHRGGPLRVAARDLLGGEQSEGGIDGTFDVEFGLPTQGQNGYLRALLGPLVSAYRGLTGIVTRQAYWGTSRYLQQIDVRATRIHRAADGSPQWYDEKAEIPHPPPDVTLPDAQLYSEYGSWDHRVSAGAVGPTAPPDPEADGWALLKGGGCGDSRFSVGDTSPPIVSFFRGGRGHSIWIKKEIPVAKPGAVTLTVTVWSDDGHWIWINGENVFAPPNAPGASGKATHVFKFNNYSNTIDLYVQGVDGYPVFAGDGIYLAVRAELAYRDVFTVYPDMNPAHILRETITDQGYTDGDIDDASLRDAADQLSRENFGLSVLWEQNDTYEEFQKDILRHIDGRLFVDPTSGQFRLKLIRSDYDEATLPVFGPDNIDYVEDYMRPQFGELTNSITVKYYDADSDATLGVTVDDPAMVQMQGGVINQVIEYPMITSAALARRVAQRDLRAYSSRLLSATLHCTRAAAGLLPGDAVAFEWPSRHVGRVICRVVEIGSGDGRDNHITLKLIEDVFALPAQAVVEPPKVGWVDPETQPLGASSPVVVEAPYYELAQRYGEPAVDRDLAAAPDSGMILVSATPSAGALNAAVYVGGSEITTRTDFSPVLTLTAPIGRLDTSAQVSAQPSLSVGQHMQIGDEIVRFDGYAADGSATIARGCLDTQPASHPVAAEFVAWDAFAVTDETYRAAGEVLSVAIRPRTETRVGALSSPVSLTMAGRAARPYPPANVQFNGAYYPENVTAGTVVTWAHRDRTMQAGSIDDWATGNIGPEAGVTYSVRVSDESGSTTLAHAEGLTDPTWTLPQMAAGTVRIIIASVRAGLSSLYPFDYVVHFGAADGRITTEAGLDILTESGAPLIIQQSVALAAASGDSPAAASADEINMEN